MDIRSPNAHVIRQAFAQNRMYALEGTAIDAETNQIYARTSEGRFVRMDQASQQLNILSPDRRTFVMSRGLRPGEEILSGPHMPDMTYDVLLPPLTVRQHIGAWAPWIAATVGSFGLGYAAHATFSSHAAVPHDTTSDHAAAQNWHEHPTVSPNHCPLDGSPQATLRAMLPGHCDAEGTHHLRMLSGDFQAVGDDQMNDHYEVPVGGYDAVDPNAYHTVIYDSSGTQWQDMGYVERGAFCAVTAAGMTGGALALGACVNGFVVQPIRGRMNARAARRSLEQFQAQQRAMRQQAAAPEDVARRAEAAPR